MTTTQLTVVILNHTNEELELVPDLMRVESGEMVKADEYTPPKQILAGESAILPFKSIHIGSGIQGEVTYRMTGFEEEASVTFTWNVHLVSANKFTHSCTLDEFNTRLLGGGGKQAVAVFVLGKSKEGNR